MLAKSWEDGGDELRILMGPLREYLFVLGTLIDNEY